MAQNVQQIVGDPDVVRAVLACKREADAARRARAVLDRQVRDAFLGIQDWSHKQPGQSREFIPKIATSIEQFTQFVKRALADFGAWFSLDLPADAPISGAAAQALLSYFLDHNLARSDELARTDFPTLVSDAVKAGCLGSLVILKVHGRPVDRSEYVVAPTGDLVRQPVRRWSVFIDLVRPEDFYIDPTGRGLYVIHEVERDLHEVQEMADAGLYDPEAVKALASTDTPLTERPPEEVATAGGATDFRRRVTISEFWGTILNPDGSVAGRNRLVVVANDRVLLRNEENPFWHGGSPFVWAPLVRVPFTVWHRGLFDAAARLNLVLNELFNLMLDGGLASVWGVRQVREDALVNPAQIAQGIPQGATILVRGEALPVGGKAIEQVTQGTVPAEALALYNLLDKEYQAASLTNDLKMGQLPERTVKATEVIEVQQSIAVTLDGIIRDLEDRLLRPLLTKVWHVILQGADDISIRDAVGAIGAGGAAALALMTPAERFAALANGRIRVYGLSAVLSKARDFQKMMALLSAVHSTPVLAQAFYARFDPGRVVDALVKKLGLDTTGMERSPEEALAAPQDVQAALLQQLMGRPPREPRAGGLPVMPMGLSPEVTGEPNLPAEIAQEMRPTGPVR